MLTARSLAMAQDVDARRGFVPPSIRAAALTPSAWASRTTVVTVGDFVPRLMASLRLCGINSLT
jgi:hypothetical protein